MNKRRKKEKKEKKVKEKKVTFLKIFLGIISK